MAEHVEIRGERVRLWPRCCPANVSLSGAVPVGGVQSEPQRAAERRSRPWESVSEATRLVSQDGGPVSPTSVCELLTSSSGWGCHPISVPAWSSQPDLHNPGPDAPAVVPSLQTEPLSLTELRTPPPPPALIQNDVTWKGKGETISPSGNGDDVPRCGLLAPG
ncbi:unnamed protein product [Arctogadus glacialis]